MIKLYRLNIFFYKVNKFIKLIEYKFIKLHFNWLFKEVVYYRSWYWFGFWILNNWLRT